LNSPRECCVCIAGTNEMPLAFCLKGQSRNEILNLYL